MKYLLKNTSYLTEVNISTGVSIENHISNVRYILKIFIHLYILNIFSKPIGCSTIFRSTFNEITRGFNPISTGLKKLR